MVKNWESAVGLASGDYVTVLTDKMFVLPGALDRARSVLEESRAEILSWTDAKFTPNIAHNYFGSGLVIFSDNDLRDGSYSEYLPMQELANRVRPCVPRGEMTTQDYARGKVCFGLYSSELIGRIVGRTGALFHPLSPDYTSLSLALAEATSAVTLHADCVVHLHTDLSNGARASRDDRLASSYLRANLPDLDFGKVGLVPGLYTSASNLVAHDLLLPLRYGYDIPAADSESWMTLIAKELKSRDRLWSSLEVRRDQLSLFTQFFGWSPESLTQFSGVSDRKALESVSTIRSLLRKSLGRISPSAVGLIRSRRARARGQECQLLRSVFDLLG